MSDAEILRQKDPALADLIDQWRSRFEGSYDLSDETQRANFYEAVTEMARHIAAGSTSGVLNLVACNDGVTGLQITCSPNACASSSD